MRSRRPPSRSSLPPDLHSFFREDLARCFAQPLGRIPWTKSEDFEIEFCEALLRRSPEHVEALAALGAVYSRRGEYAKGLAADQRICELRPRSAVAHYNLACSYCLTGQLAAAFETLEKSLRLGYRDWEHLLQDDDLAPVRAEPRFQALRDEWTAKAAQSREA